MPGKHGGTLRRGSAKGNTPGTGRPPDAFKALCQSLASRDLTVAAVTAILEDPSHAQFISALKWATENGYGRAAQTVELTVSGIADQMRLARERVASADD